MDYKEKYEEAFERAKECYKKSIEQGWTCDKEIYENIFPELRESDDERNQIIKKEVIEMLHYYHSKSPCFIPPQFSLEETLAWLEKQVNIPHFTYDDILALQCAMKVTEKADNELYEQLKSLHDKLHDVYWLEKQGAEPNWCHHKVDLSNCSEEYRKAYYDGWNNCNQQHEQLKAEQKHVEQDTETRDLWEYIKEWREKFGRLPKDEDELADCIFYVMKRQKPTMIQWKGNNLKEVINFTGVYKEGFEKWFHNSWEEYEQYVNEHNNIFKIFNEDGSHIEVPVGAWIVKTPDGYNTASRYVFRQKPTEWSEEDEEMFDAIIADIKFTQKAHNHDVNQVVYEREIDWLKSIKDRIQPQPKQTQQKPADNYCQENCKGYRDTGGKCFADGECEAKKKAEQKPTWNKEDDEKSMWLVRLISTAGFRELDNDKMPCSRSELLDWLKSIKPNHWKPSEEQLMGMEIAINVLTDNRIYIAANHLQSIYNDLKKL